MAPAAWLSWPATRAAKGYLTSLESLSSPPRNRGSVPGVDAMRTIRPPVMYPMPYRKWSPLYIGGEQTDDNETNRAEAMGCARELPRTDHKELWQRAGEDAGSDASRRYP